MAFKKFIPGIAWFFLVMFLICLPGNEFPKHTPWLEKIYFDKWVHIGLFSILSFLWMMPFAKMNKSIESKLNVIFKIALSISIWGLATEFIQKYFIPFRSFDLTDWAADSVGVLLAWIYWRKKIKNSKVQKERL
jgi:VanZ family protein